MRRIKAIQERRWPLTHKRVYVNVWSSQLLPPLHSRIFLSKVAMALPDLLERNGYPKSGMNFVTKPLENLRTSSLRRPCTSSRNLANLLRCIRGRVILYCRSIDASWMAIVYESMKLNGPVVKGNNQLMRNKSSP
jgi:hypothetical protein